MLFRSKDEHFAKYLPEYKNLNELKAHYRKGGLGDVKIKNFLASILIETISPIRERRAKLAQNKEAIYKELRLGSAKAHKTVMATLQEVKSAMGINYEF